MKTLIAVVALAGILQSGDATISQWTIPAIATKTGAGTLTVQENQATTVAIQTLAATTTDGTSVTYTLKTTGTPFAVASTGALTTTTALDYDTGPSYTIEVEAVDNAGTPDTGTATITITVNDAPAFASTSFSVCVADGLTAGTSVYTVTATDQNTGDTISYSITGGDTNGDFQLTGSEIQVATGKTLDSATTASYPLQVEADDTALTATATVSITVGDCSTATTFAVSVLTLLLGLVTALYSF